MSERRLGGRAREGRELVDGAPQRAVTRSRRLCAQRGGEIEIGESSCSRSRPRDFTSEPCESTGYGRTRADDVPRCRAHSLSEPSGVLLGLWRHASPCVHRGGSWRDARRQRSRRSTSRSSGMTRPSRPARAAWSCYMACSDRARTGDRSARRCRGQRADPFTASCVHTSSRVSDVPGPAQSRQQPAR